MVMGRSVDDASPRRWSVGNIRITRVIESIYDEGLEQFFPEHSPEAIKKLGWLEPHFATADGKLSYSIHAFIIEAGDTTIMVDTCVGDNKPRSSYFQWDLLQTNFLKNLEASGFSPGDIDVVLCTHLHLDHVGWNTRLVDGKWVPTFANARYLFGAREYEWLTSLRHPEKPHAHAYDMLDDSIAPIIEAGMAEFVDANHRICDGVWLMPTYGHTAGHVSVVIESDDNKALITGDFIHHPCQLAHPHWGVGADHDPEMATLCRKEVLSILSGTPTLVLGTHWSEPTAGKVVRDGDFFRLKVD